MKKILVTIPFTDHHKEKLLMIAPDAEVRYSSPQEVTKEEVQEANIILGNVPPAFIQGSPNLEWLQLNSAGADAYIATGVLSEKTLLTNATGAYGLAISEHMLAVLLSLQKKLPLYQNHQQKHEWADEGQVVSIYGSTALVVGLGDIGGEFAKKLHALGSKVIGIRRNKAEKPEYLDGIYQMDALDELLPTADIVALSLPNTKETVHLFDKDKLAKMKPGAILLNVGRGSAIDSDALCEALNSGRLGGAGLDVTEPEPLPKESPLWDAKNIFLTPHVSGAYHLPETLERIIGIALFNLQAFTNGEPLRNMVDFTTGYRKFIG